MVLFVILCYLCLVLCVLLCFVMCVFCVHLLCSVCVLFLRKIILGTWLHLCSCYVFGLVYVFFYMCVLCSVGKSPVRTVFTSDCGVLLRGWVLSVDYCASNVFSLRFFFDCGVFGMVKTSHICFCFVFGCFPPILKQQNRFSVFAKSNLVNPLNHQFSVREKALVRNIANG